MSTDGHDESTNLPEKTEQSSADSFLDAISALALKAKENTPAPYVQPSTDLMAINMEEYPEVEIPEKTLAKIDELQSIIQSIENRPASTTEIQLRKKYPFFTISFKN